MFLRRDRLLRVAAEAVAIGGAWAVLNRTASLFEVRPGLAFFFPAAAVTVLAGARLRWLAAPVMIAANFLSPWGASVGFWRVLVFGLPGAVWALAVAAASGVGDGTWRRLQRFVLGGVLGGSLASSLLGGVLLTLLVGPRSWATLSTTTVSWWIPDLAAALSVGLALVVLFAPQCLMSEESERMWRRWGRTGAEVGGVVAMILGGIAASWMLAQISSVTVHWFVVVLLPAIVVAGLRGGVGASLVTGAVISTVYTGLALADLWVGSGDLVEMLATAYGNIAVFMSFAVFTGVLGARNRKLVARVREQGKLLAQGLEDTVEALVAAIGAKEEGSEGHIQRVAKLAVLVGRELGLDDETLGQTRHAAILHDIGKLGVPGTVLNKPGSLDGDERARVRRQVELGAAILDRVEFLVPVREVVRCQKERWDGRQDARYSGCFGLAGEAIPLGSRIIAAVEAYDAMTHDRPYRKALTREAAVAELWRCSGAQFDPDVVAALTRVLRDEWDVSSEDLAFSRGA